MIDSATKLKRYLAAGFLAFWTGCVAYASPAPWVDCYTQLAPHPYCEADFIWIPGHWTMDYYGRRVWNPGYYARRMTRRR